VLLKKQIAPVLEKGGLHAYMRHPLYSGTLLFIWALFLIFPFMGNLIACVIITVYTLIGIRMEEKKLVIEFGEEYKSYAHQTPMLIPTFRGQKH
jgi:protein-S-isoprenylcysteine O-methyltransferase Ste14